MLAAGGGSGWLSLIIRGILIRIFLMTLCVVLLVAAIVTLAERSERTDYVSWHYNGITQFSQLPENGSISVTFTNSFNKKLKITDVRLLVESVKNSNKAIAFESDDLHSYRDDGIAPTDFILGPHQSVTMQVPYRFSPVLKRNVDGQEVDHLEFGAIDGYSPFSKKYIDPSFVMKN